MSFLRAALVGAACLLCAATVVASPGDGATTPVAASPLQGAVRAIWGASPDVQAARADVEAAQARVRAASQPVYNPSLSLDAENADVDRRTAGLSLPLDLSGKRRARTSQADAEWRSREASYELLRRDVASRWLKAWSGAALAGRQRELGAHRVELMRRFDALAAERLAVGDISSPERDLAALALGEAQIQQASLAGNEAATLASLEAIAGDEVKSPPPLPAGLPPLSNSIVPLSMDDRPELLKARADEAAAQAGIDVARRARIPDPTVSLTGGRVRTGATTDQVIGLSVTIPLPVLNSGRAEVDAALAEAGAAAATVRSRQLASRASLREAQARYDALRDSGLAFSQGRAAAFDDRAALLEKLWRAGEISTSDYLVQLKQSLDTALSALTLESQAWQAWFDYLTAAGRLTDWLDGRTQEAAP
ncbi:MULTISPECIES: TolC family protein [unclassified Dyella]|uniref:TolC family protein n=1 Tax=unclassified Dyella TaxID=2634549 RepID=UPI000C8319AC|nr:MULTISPECIES: TolC family protein [unclassified Dyella]MDR3445456.1 TolC family protein [Dyella sp.]PMQ05318.1 Cobalt-zinc-cadmium resistance protein CzcC [Dyella sp. AD56]